MFNVRAIPENFEQMVGTIIIFSPSYFVFFQAKDGEIHFYGRWPQMMKQPRAAIAAVSVQLLLKYSFLLLLMYHESDFTSTDAGIKSECQ